MAHYLNSEKWILLIVNKVIEEWDDRGNRQSIDRQEHEIEQISKAIYQASELLLDKEGSLNIISGNDQNQSTNYFLPEIYGAVSDQRSLKRHHVKTPL